MSQVAATTAEEFALILEPFPFLDDETKSRLVEKSKPFFEFLKYMTEKHNTTPAVIQARVDMTVNAKMAKKMANLEMTEDIATGDTDVQVKAMMREIFAEVGEEEGFDGNLGDYAVELMGIQEAMEGHVEKLISEGKEEELKNFITLMENQG